MKKQIRKSVFETNSSSTHSICINSKENLVIPEQVAFSTSEEFGWENELHNDLWTKASYFYLSLVDYIEDKLHEDTNHTVKDLPIHEQMKILLEELKKYENMIETWLHEVGVQKVTFYHPSIGISNWTNKEEAYYQIEGYIDHIGDTKDFIRALLEDKDLFYHYLFVSDSCVITGNDNDDMEIDEPDTCDVVFYKGN